MNQIEADHLKRDYVCAHCWQELMMTFDKKGEYRVYCLLCDKDAGFVTKEYVSHRRSDNQFEKLEVDKLLKNIGIINTPKRTEAEILKDLGF